MTMARRKQRGLKNGSKTTTARMRAVAEEEVVEEVPSEAVESEIAVVSAEELVSRLIKRELAKCVHEVPEIGVWQLPHAYHVDAASMMGHARARVSRFQSTGTWHDLEFALDAVAVGCLLEPV